MLLPGRKWMVTVFQIDCNNENHDSLFQSDRLDKWSSDLR